MNNTAAADDVDSINFMYFYIQLSFTAMLIDLKKIVFHAKTF